jgi:hypothetical protein
MHIPFGACHGYQMVATCAKTLRVVDADWLEVSRCLVRSLEVLQLDQSGSQRASATASTRAEVILGCYSIALPLTRGRAVVALGGVLATKAAPRRGRPLSLIRLRQNFKLPLANSVPARVPGRRNDSYLVMAWVG